MAILSKTELGQYSDAIEDYNEAIQMDPYEALAYYNRGRTYRKMGQEVESNKDFDRAMELAQEQGDAELKEKIRSARE